MNISSVHTDFMVGCPSSRWTALTKDGKSVVILRDETWQLPEWTREDKYAELVLRVGANVQPGQLVDVMARVEHAEVARAVTRAAYRAGAAYVDVYYTDQHIRRALIEGAADDMLSWTRPWLLKRSVQIGDERAAVDRADRRCRAEPACRPTGGARGPRRACSRWRRSRTGRSTSS